MFQYAEKDGFYTPISYSITSLYADYFISLQFCTACGISLSKSDFDLNFDNVPRTVRNRESVKADYINPTRNLLVGQCYTPFPLPFVSSPHKLFQLQRFSNLQNCLLCLITANEVEKLKQQGRRGEEEASLPPDKRFQFKRNSSKYRTEY